jgi:hypothetical protein
LVEGIAERDSVTVPERDSVTVPEKSSVSIQERGFMSILASAVAIAAGGAR